MKDNPKKRGSKAFAIFVTICVLLILSAAAFVAGLWLGFFDTGDSASIKIPSMQTLPGAAGNGTTAPVPTTTVPPETTMPEPEKIVATATISSMGDVLMHMPVVNSGKLSDGSYNFDKSFQYIKEYVEAADYAAANLETTLAGTDNGYPYKGYPHFNCPDEIVDGVMGAGFDMMLTVNNHSYDTTMVGYKRTLEVVREKGMATLGTMLNAEEPKYVVQDINGIKVGMMAYTYATAVTSDGRPSLNGNAAMSEAGVCNYFTYENLPAFYKEVQGHLDAMKAEGAEATMIFIHWGVEYQLKENAQQAKIAQELCNLGIDVIVGGHPHVVQPVDLLTSTTDSDHKTVCLYSMGNAISNQRLGNISYVKTSHTEDGVLFSVTFCKYSDGSVYLLSTDILPTWVHLDQSGSPNTYFILPLDDERSEEWDELYGLNDTYYQKALNSYERTMDIVGEGLAECQTYLEEAGLIRDWEYLAAVNPEAAGERPVPTTEATVPPTE